MSAFFWPLLAVAVIASGAWFVRKAAPYYQDEEPLTGRHHVPDVADGERQTGGGA